MDLMLEKAEELGRVLGQSDEYRALQRAQDNLESRQDFRERMTRLQQLAETLERQAEAGNEPPAADVEEYDRLFGEIQAESAYQTLVAAQANFDKLMVRVHEGMAQGMRKGAESRIITLG